MGKKNSHARTHTNSALRCSGPRVGVVGSGRRVERLSWVGRACVLSASPSALSSPSPAVSRSFRPRVLSAVSVVCRVPRRRFVCTAVRVRVFAVRLSRGYFSFAVCRRALFFCRLPVSTVLLIFFYFSVTCFSLVTGARVCVCERVFIFMYTYIYVRRACHDLKKTAIAHANSGRCIISYLCLFLAVALVHGFCSAAVVVPGNWCQ